MKMIAGAFDLACSNSLRTRDAPTPTNTSMNSEPLAEKNGTPASPATARASSVLPVPGGPTSSAPFGTRAPSDANFDGLRRNLTISSSSSFASSTPATESKPVCGAPFLSRRARRPRVSAVIDFTGFMRLYDMPSTIDEREPREDAENQRDVRFVGLDALIGDVLRLEQRHDRVVRDGRGDPHLGSAGLPRAVGRQRPHLGRRHAHFAHVALGDVLLQRAVGNFNGVPAYRTTRRRAPA